MKKLLLFVVSLFLTVGVMAQIDTKKEYRIKSKDDGKYLASLATLALQALAQVGVEASDVVDAKRSTFANDELFYSYRRDGVTGRHATMIWMKE